MKIIELLSKSSIQLGASVSNKSECIDLLVELMDKNGNLNSKEQYKTDVLERESHSTTGIGENIAIPHAKSTGVSNAGLSCMILKDGVDFDSVDKEDVNICFMIAAPDTKEDIHIEVLQRLSMLLMDNTFRENLIKAKTKGEVLAIIDEAETAKFKTNQKVESNSKSSYEVLAVTACPTGIAHTFMAAESLEKAGLEKGISIKVETNGSGGAKNVLTNEEIANAKCIIIAADKKVEMARFNGKKVIITKVSDGIHKADELITKAVSGNVSEYSHDGEITSTDSSNENSIMRQIYIHLMNGVSNMLPFVIGGGILIALAFLFDDYAIDPSNFGSNTEFAAFLKTIGGEAFGFMLPILAGFIAMSIADRPGLAVGFVGGALAASGGSGFLGALLAGFAAGYIVNLLKKICSKFPAALEGVKPTLIYPLFGILIIGALMTFVINDPVTALNDLVFEGLNSMGDTSKVLLGILLAGMMSVDMGGPINKAAYVFGTASIAEGNYEIMAAVMIGGMVPPLVIAIATTFFKNKFTEDERKAGLVNYIMGLSFISEGAIPFAASDPLRVLPSCIIGSAIAGGLSMLFGCTLMAPHGGIFVLPVIGNAAMYFLALMIGSIVGMIILGSLKKKVN